MEGIAAWDVLFFGANSLCLLVVWSQELCGGGWQGLLCYRWRYEDVVRIFHCIKRCHQDASTVRIFIHGVMCLSVVGCLQFANKPLLWCHRTDKAVIASAGMQADRVTLHKLLKARLKQYKFQHEKDMSTKAISQLLSQTLYGRRFFPYYTFNVVGGIDEDGTWMGMLYRPKHLLQLEQAMIRI